MDDLTTIIATYQDGFAAQQDWDRIEIAAEDGSIDLADAAMVRRDHDGDVYAVHRQSHHGWGKGAVAGAVFGLLFPPSLLGSAAVGAGGGALVARLNRSFDRGDIKDLGEVMDEGEVTLVVVCANASTDAARALIEGADKVASRPSGKADEMRAALRTEEATAG
jgi:uncharacterized membrane protein